MMQLSRNWQFQNYVSRFVINKVKIFWELLIRKSLWANEFLIRQYIPPIFEGILKMCLSLTDSKTTKLYQLTALKAQQDPHRP